VPVTDASPVERLAVACLALAALIGVLAPALQLGGASEPIPALDRGVLQAVGVVLGFAGACLIFAAQLAMGDSWRIGVDAEERTALVTGGPFGLVRNPVYSMVMLAYLGAVLMLGSALIVAGFLLLLVGMQVQVRAVEEPYLAAVHGEEYAAYAATVGRFLPRIAHSSRPPP